MTTWSYWSWSEERWVPCNAWLAAKVCELGGRVRLV